MSRTLKQDLPLTALNQALLKHCPTIHHSDQGGQYAALAYIRRLKAADVQISMAAVGKATENGYAERVIRTIKDEQIYLSEYLNFEDAYAPIGYFIETVYQYKRIQLWAI